MEIICLHISNKIQTIAVNGDEYNWNYFKGAARCDEWW